MMFRPHISRAVSRGLLTNKSLLRPPNATQMHRFFSDDSSEVPAVELPELNDLKLELEMTLDTFKTTISPLGSSNVISQFENLTVIPYGPGSNCSLSSVAQITQKGTSEITLNLFDSSTLQDVSKSIQTNKTITETLGSLNPSCNESAGEITIKLPAQNSERKSKLLSLIKSSHQKYVKSVREHRKVFMDQCKKSVKDGTSKDEGKRREKEGERVVKESQKLGDKVLEEKIVEID